MKQFWLKLPSAAPLFSLLLILLALSSAEVQAGKLYVGGATASITPDKPVGLDGMRNTRVSKSIKSPCTATALAMETRNGDESLSHVVFVSCDLIAIRGGDDFYASVREELQGRVPDSLLNCLILNGTHTHTAPVLRDDKYDFPEQEMMLPNEYRKFLLKQLGDIIVQAWESRAPARVAWGLGHAVIAQNRRATYADGSAVMYGSTNKKSFRGIEGNEDHGVELLYFWDENDKLIATVINVAAPSQEQGGNTLSADFWHPVREMLREKHGDSLLVLAWCGAAGDQATRLLYRRAAEDRMRKLRGIDSLTDLARRIVVAWEDVYGLVKKEQKSDVVLEYRSKTISLPHRKITADEVALARNEVAKLKGSTDTSAAWSRGWYQGVVDRYELQQQADQFHEMELRVVRLGDVAIATNDFELFTDFGVQMKARSPALQTFVIQLCGPGKYIPTERAVSGGGYSAIPQSNVVGPEGGQVLVDETVELIDSLWKK